MWGLPRGHQALSPRHLSVSGPGPRLVRGAAGSADDEPVWRVPAECVRRFVGLPEGPRGTARPSGARRGHVDPRRFGIVALVRTSGDPAIPAHARPRESPPPGRGSPCARLDPFDRAGGRHGLEADRHGDVVHEKADPGESVLESSTAERTERGHREGRPHVEPVGPEARRRPGIGHGSPGGGGRRRPLRPRDLAEPYHPRLFRRLAGDKGPTAARPDRVVDHRGRRHPGEEPRPRGPIVPVDLGLRGDERERTREQRRGPDVPAGVHVRGTRGLEPGGEPDAGPRP